MDQDTGKIRCQEAPPRYIPVDRDGDTLISEGAHSFKHTILHFKRDGSGIENTLHWFHIVITIHLLLGLLPMCNSFPHAKPLNQALIHTQVHTWVIFCANGLLWITLSNVEVVQKVILLQVMSIMITTSFLTQYLMDPPSHSSWPKKLTYILLASAGGIYLQLPWRWHT
ncbi:hypothetical protein BDZ97DRAFT_1762166 [Flammula alnicola]|nr:hypothetical protein BDZ97DRAFT_1762166 [Flammula alnicola]